MPFDELVTFVRLSTLAAAVAFVLWSSAVNANPIRQSVCPLDEYFDGIGKKCVKCSQICRPDLPQDFCQNNCRDYLSSTTPPPRAEAPRVQPVIMMTTQPSTHAVPEARQQSILPPNNGATTSAASPSTLEVVIIAVVCVSAVAILVVVVIVIVVVVILYRMKVTTTSQDTKAKEATDQVSNNRTTTKADAVEKINNWRFGCIRSQLSSESNKGLLDANNTN